MKKYLRWLLLAAALIAVYPLATWLALNVYQDDPDAMAWTDREAYNRKFINALQLSATVTQDQIRQKLGGPDITEAYQAGTDLYQLVYYRTQRDISDGITTKTECTALLYLNRRLIAVGENAVQQFRQARPARP
ncbi:DUF3192 domain-containing protein [Rheinheimera texasensis]|uniref:DUF3192 domain-containing protein n=1 Tax=Rheinheimera texasensis TaxID=306205 RepID=UPI0004E0F3B2|nr:DUF3192 domain-containing protein [Rheinheimera texasensis]